MLLVPLHRDFSSLHWSSNLSTFQSTSGRTTCSVSPSTVFIMSVPPWESHWLILSVKSILSVSTFRSFRIWTLTYQYSCFESSLYHIFLSPTNATFVLSITIPQMGNRPTASYHWPLPTKPLPCSSRSSPNVPLLPRSIAFNFPHLSLPDSTYYLCFSLSLLIWFNLMLSNVLNCPFRVSVHVHQIVSWETYLASLL